jgi:hypothetical protein
MPVTATDVLVSGELIDGDSHATVLAVRKVPFVVMPPIWRIAH